MKIRIYKMTHATGFAPNYDCGILTLATCKPGIREKAEIGEWIAGFTSTSKTAGGTPRGQERLIYLMKVTDKITFDKYWKKYPRKRPEYSELGDNIYFLEGIVYKQTDKAKYHTDKEERDKDLLSDKVLISTEFKYFGKENPLDISEYREYIKIPYGVSRWGYESSNDKVAEFIEFVMKQEAKSDIDYSTISIKKANSCSK